jgi:hypothetical protein
MNRTNDFVARLASFKIDSIARSIASIFMAGSDYPVSTSKVSTTILAKG